jgi:hypothetical protein
MHSVFCVKHRSAAISSSSTPILKPRVRAERVHIPKSKSLSSKKKKKTASSSKKKKTTKKSKLPTASSIESKVAAIVGLPFKECHLDKSVIGIHRVPEPAAGSVSIADTTYPHGPDGHQVRKPRLLDGVHESKYWSDAAHHSYRVPMAAHLVHLYEKRIKNDIKIEKLDRDSLIHGIKDAFCLVTGYAWALVPRPSDKIVNECSIVTQRVKDTLSAFICHVGMIGRFADSSMMTIDLTGCTGKNAIDPHNGHPVKNTADPSRLVANLHATYEQGLINHFLC